MALYLISGFLSMMAFTPLPTLPLLVAGTGLGALAWTVQRLAKRERMEREVTARQEAAAVPKEPAPVEDLLAVDTLEIEIGYGLVRLVDSTRGDLLDRVSMIRRQLAGEIGLVMPPIRIRDNMQIDANLYRVKLRGAVVGEGTVYPELLMAMDSGLATGTIEGVHGKEPAFGLDALWITPELKTRAETMNYTVVDPTSVIATHITEIVRTHAAELLSREEVGNLLEQLKKSAPKLVEEVVPGIVRPGEVQKILQNLLRERVPVRDLETIIETLGDWASHTKDVAVLTEYVRNALRRTISAQYAEPGPDGALRLYCVTMDPAGEDIVDGYIERAPTGTTMAMPPGLAGRVAAAVSETAEPLVAAGHQLIVLTSPRVRAQIKQILDAHVQGAVVMSYNEVIEGLDVESMGLVHFDPATAHARASASAAAVATPV